MKSHPASLAPHRRPRASPQRYGAGLRQTLPAPGRPGRGSRCVLALQAVAVGSYDLSPYKVLMILRWAGGRAPQEVVVWNIRLPRITAALVTGWGLGLSGLMTQSLLAQPPGLALHPGHEPRRDVRRGLCHRVSGGRLGDNQRPVHHRRGRLHALQPLRGSPCWPSLAPWPPRW